MRHVKKFDVLGQTRLTGTTVLGVFIIMDSPLLCWSSLHITKLENRQQGPKRSRQEPPLANVHYIVYVSFHATSKVFHEHIVQPSVPIIFAI